MKSFGVFRSIFLLVFAILLLWVGSSPASNQSALDTMLFLLMSTGTTTVRDSAGGPQWDDIIIEAIKSGNIDQVNKLLDKGAGPNARHRMGGSALRWAAISGHREIVIALLNHGAKVNMEQGGPLEERLLYSTIRGEFVKVLYLLRLGANVNANAEIGETPLHWACVMGYTHLVEVLLVEGANVNSVSRNGCTPLTFAALHGHEQMVKRLLDYGADPGIKGWQADPKGLAEQKGHHNIVRLLETHRTSPTVSSKVATESKSQKKTATDEKGVSGNVVPSEKLRWIFHAGKDYVTDPTTVNETAYFTSTTSEDSNSKSCLHAVDLNTGQQNWKLEVRGSVVTRPVIANNVAYFGSYEDQPDTHWAHAVDIGTRQEKWKFEAKGQVVWISSVMNGVVYFGTLGAHVYAVNADTGQEKWRYITNKLGSANTRQDHVSSLSVVDGTVYFGTGDGWSEGFGHLVALDANTGEEKWPPLKTWKQAHEPVVSDGVVYVGSNDGCLYAVDVATGLEKWRFNARSESANTARVIGIQIWNDVGYLRTLNGPTGFSTNDAFVIAVDLKSGGTRWKAKTGAAFLYTISLINGNVYVTGSDGHLYVFNSETGRLRSKFRFRGEEETGPAAIEGGIFFWSGGGRLCAMDTAAIPLTQRETEPSPPLDETAPVATDRKPQGEDEISDNPQPGPVDQEWQVCETLKNQRSSVELSESGSDLPRIPGSQEPKRPPGLKWKIRVGEFFSSPIVVSDGLVFFFPVNSKLLAVDCHKGRERWKFPNSWRPDVTARTGLVFFRGGKTLYAWDIKTRQLRWKQEEWTSGRICAADGMIVTETADGYICGLDMNTGAVMWKFVMGHRLHRPTAEDGMAFTVASENIIYGLDLITGRNKWEHKLKETAYVYTTVSGGVIYLGSGEGDTFSCQALDIRTNREKWKVSCAEISAAPSVGEGVACFPSSDCLYGLDSATGRLLWKFQTNGLWSTPAIADGRAYFRDRETFYALDLKTGEVSWKFYLASDSSVDYDVAVADGVVYFGGNDGYLYAIETKSAEQKYTEQ